ncbi:baseplate assembly protein [Pannonibacter sp. SL95]|uniref:baseplate assembly protein n=1 Tax=Pannonibacter sp. SL95 TaxID=2995153 RepID=UPI0022750C7E|nr:baseplate J/gp47 family protein [Pannonibacter sp. SL95]MCY1705243.1 baseplate J/gp47 family protein [Pannonibacter sp. SL95]
MTSRFVDIDLSRLPAPDALQPLDHEAAFQQRLADFIARMDAAGQPFDVGTIDSDPAAILLQHGAFFEVQLTAAVNDAVKATHLAFARGADLEQRAADLGVVRQVLVPADPATTPPTPAIMESDESLRRRRQLAIEAFSTAGPDGAYLFFGLAAHPHVLDVAVYDPHSGLANDGEALIVVASSQGDGVPTPAVLDAMAEFLDAGLIRYAVGSPRVRALTRRQKLRPLTDRVIIEACSTLDCTISVTLKMPRGPDPSTLRTLALARLTAYLASRRGIARMLSDTAIAAAVHVADAAGVALVEDADIVITAAGQVVSDVLPGPKELARVTAVTLTVEVI